MDEHRAHFEIYIDSAGEERWRFIAGNGEEMADSNEGYAAGHGEVARAIERYRDLVRSAPVVKLASGDD